jgi:hypothetical protein
MCYAHVMVAVPAAVFVFAALLTFFTRRGSNAGMSILGAAASVIGTALATLVAVRGPLVGWALPSFAGLLVLIFALHMYVLALALAARSQRPGAPIPTRALARRWALLSGALAVFAAVVFGFGLARSRGRIDGLALGSPACARGDFHDRFEKYDFLFESGGYRVRTHQVPGSDMKCTLDITTPTGEERSVPLLMGSSYETPMCAGGELVLCGRDRLLFVEDWSPNPFVPETSRFRGFRLPGLEPFETTTRGSRAVLAPPRTVLALAALGILAALAGVMRALRSGGVPKMIPALAAIAAVLAVPLLIVLVRI